MKEGKYSICAEGLSAGYEKKTIVSDVDIELQQGEILAVTGPNGSGKSTILHTLMGALRIQKGIVYIKGSNMSELPRKELAKNISAIFTGKIKNDMAVCYEIVSGGRYPYTGLMGVLSDKDKSKIKEAMELMDVWQLAGSDFNKLSDGQKQRVLIARAICREPDIIILDEPTSYLDVKYQVELMRTLYMLAKERKLSIIFSVHEIEFARKLADKVLCIRDGSIMYYGDIKALSDEKLVKKLYDLDDDSYAVLTGKISLKQIKTDNTERKLQL